jgi:protein-disulfide isomerase
LFALAAVPSSIRPQGMSNVSPEMLEVDQLDHLRGSGAPLILEYGDYECPYSRAAYREIQQVEKATPIRFAFRHFPLTEIHPHALAASAAAEAASLQGRFWEMHDHLFHRQKALASDDLFTYAAELGLDLDRFGDDIDGEAVLARIRRDVESGIASGEVRGTPTLFINGTVHRGPYDTAALLEAISS